MTGCVCAGSALDQRPDASDFDPASQPHDNGVTTTDRPRPLRKSATLGSSRILECEVRYPGGVYVKHIVTWRKVGVEAPIFILFDGYPPRMDSSFYGRIRAKGQASIELSDIRMSDEGWYECSVLFLDGSDDISVNGTWIHLTVNGNYRLTPFFTRINSKKLIKRLKIPTFRISLCKFFLLVLGAYFYCIVCPLLLVYHFIMHFCFFLEMKTA